MRNENEEIKLTTTKMMKDDEKKVQFRFEFWNPYERMIQFSPQHTQKSNFSQIESSGDELRLSELTFDLVFPSSQMLCVYGV